MMNYPLESYSDSPIYGVQTGGAKQDKPNGGFPPIILCKERESVSISENDSKAREFESPKESVSIQTIMDKRREVIPFI